eukprot:scaffold1284_cov108-Cylindrotheca_fusiformis.AAC.5
MRGENEETTRSPSFSLTASLALVFHFSKERRQREVFQRKKTAARLVWGSSSVNEPSFLLVDQSDRFGGSNKCCVSF